MESQKKVSLAAGAVGSMTFLSRIFGFIRDLVLAMMLGASPHADAFFVAFRIPNVQRRILGEGAVTSAMIPVYGDYLSTKGKEETQRFASNLFNIQFFFLVIATLAIFVFAPYVITLFAPGFLDDPEKFDMTVLLTRWMAPYLLLVGMSAFCMGILNSHGVFGLPAGAPVLVNISMILGALFLSPWMEQPVLGVTAGVLIGGIFQLLVQLPATLKRGLKFTNQFSFRDPGIIRVAKLMGPAIISFGVYEINLLVDTLLASLLAGGSISYLYYANRMVQLPLGVFGVALGVALLPTLTQQAARQEFIKLRDTLSFGIRLILFITVPATVGLILISFPMVNTLWERGEFLRATTEGTTIALIYYSVGLCAFAGTRIMVSAYYSLHDTTTPMKVGMYSMFVNIGLGLTLMGPMKHGGLALATSLASIFNAAVLVYLMKKRLGRLGGRKIIKSLVKLTGAAAIMGALVFAVNAFLFDPEASLQYRLTILFLEVLVGVLSFYAVSRMSRNEELEFLTQLYRERKKRTAE